jgi:hypothetical protein
LTAAAQATQLIARSSRLGRFHQRSYDVHQRYVLALSGIVACS